MTDDQQWQAPGSAVPPPPPKAVPPSVAQAAPPSAPDFPGPAGGGWVPPPKPGLIPLRPMTLGTILGAAFQTLRRSPAILAPALMLSLAVALIQSLGSAGFLTQYFGAVSDLGNTSVSGSSSGSIATSLTSSFLGILFTSLASGVLTLFITAIVQGLVTVQVASSTLGNRLRLGAIWRQMRGRRGAVLGWAALTGLVSLLAIAIVAGLLVLIGLTGSAGIVVAVLLGLLLGSGMLILFVWLWVKLGFVPAAIVLERTSIRSSMSRSWRLTRGAFWRIFGTRLLVAAMLYVATQIIATPVALIFSLAGAVLQPNGATTAAASSSLVLSVIITQAVTAVITSVGLVVATATSALLYLDQRMRLEGLDLDLARFSERRQAGERGLPDPFLRADSAASLPSSSAPSGAV